MLGSARVPDDGLTDFGTVHDLQPAAVLKAADNQRRSPKTPPKAAT
jgi:hypothetical protein